MLSKFRLAEIRANLSTGENADPSCLACNEHVLLAEVDRLTAERDLMAIEAPRRLKEIERLRAENAQLHAALVEATWT